jgi:acyl-CoA synthetase (NDP forming)
MTTDQDSPVRFLLAPKSVAVLGASSKPGSVGAAAIENFTRMGFDGPVWPVNPRAVTVAGLPAFPDLASLPAVPDCVMICLPAALVPRAVSEAAAAGARAAVVIASGFAEAGETGEALQSSLMTTARASGMAVCGPNCLGIASPRTGQAAYTAPLPDDLRAGGVGLVSQSGTAAILLTNLGRFGFSHVISSGNEAVTGLADYVRFLALDHDTTVIGCFLESVRDPEGFADAVRLASAAGKQVVVLKVGRSTTGKAASAAHTASLSTDADVFDRYLSRIGARSARDLDEFVEAISLAEADLPPSGGGLAVIGISGGANVLLCDLAEEAGLEFEQFTETTNDTLGKLLGDAGVAMNPFDAGFFLFDEARHVAALDAIAADARIDVIAISQDLPAAMGAHEAAIYRRVTERIAAFALRTPKPVVCFTTVSGDLHPDALQPLVAASVPVLRGARAALSALAGWQSATQAPVAESAAIEPIQKWVERFSTGRPLSESESTDFLSQHGIPVTRRSLATTAEEAVAAATAMGLGHGWAVALKVQSPAISHKSDIGGVRLGLISADEVARAFGEIIDAVRARRPDAALEGVLVQEMVPEGLEVIVGADSSRSRWPTLLVGAGGVFTELVRRTAVDLLPGPDPAWLFDQSGLTPLLNGYRGAPSADTAALTAVVERVGAIGHAYAPWLATVEINPVIVGAAGRGARAVDALVVPKGRGEK